MIDSCLARNCPPDVSINQNGRRRRKEKDIIFEERERD